MLALQDSVCLQLVVHGDGKQTGDDLCDDVGRGVVTGDTTVVKSHERHRRVEMTATDGTAKEAEGGQSCTDGSVASVRARALLHARAGHARPPGASPLGPSSFSALGVPSRGGP